MTIKDLEKLSTYNVWLVTLHSAKMTGKIEKSELGDDWIRLMPFDNPSIMLKENSAWNCLDIPANVYIPDIRVVYELIKLKEPPVKTQS